MTAGFLLSMVAGVALAVSSAVPASAHKFHASIAEVECNAKSGSVEISVRMFVDDLEESVSRLRGRKLRIDLSKDFDAAALEYLRSSLVIEDPAGSRLALQWVGKEVDVDVVWVYVEAKGPSTLVGSKLADRIFFDLFDDQVNTVVLKDHGGKTTLVFKPGDGAKLIEAQNRSR